MGGFFGAISQRNCILDVFFGTDYHSHLGTRRGGMAVYDHETGASSGKSTTLKIPPSVPNLTAILDEIQRATAGIGCISDTDPQPLLVRSHLGMYAICTVGIINNAEAAGAETYSPSTAASFRWP